MREVRSLTEVEAFEAVVRDAAGRTAARLRNLPEDGLALLRHLKFELAGHHPLEPRPLNLIEQVNQTWTCLVSLKAARMLLERHPEAGGFRLNLATAAGFDLESLVPGVAQAETFAAVDPRNNRKLAKDLLRMRERGTATHRYVVFAAPGFDAGRHARLEGDSGVEVWTVDV